MDMTYAEAETYLLADGDLGVPCSRYGRTTSDCIPVAWAMASIYHDANGDVVDADLLDACMSLVVNDHDDVETIIREHGTAEQVALLD